MVARTPSEELPPRARRDSGVLIDEGDVVGEEEIRGPLSGGYRPSSLRLIDEAVAAAQAIEPSLFEPEELAAAGLSPSPSPSAAAQAEPAAVDETPLARIRVTTRSSDPRIDNARDLVERTPALADAEPPTNGASAPRKRITQPPPIPARRPTQREIAEAPLLDADPYTSGEHEVLTEQEVAEAQLLDADPYTSGEIDTELAGDDSGVPTVIEAEETPELADEGITDPSRRRFAATIRRDDSHGMRMIGSHGRDRAEASGELRPIPVRHSGQMEAEPQRELVTIMPRRITREIPIQTPDGPKPPEVTVESELAETPEKSDEITDKIEKVDGKPAVEPPPRPPPRRVTVEGGVVRHSGPGRGAMVLIGLASVLAGATVYSYCKKPKPAQRAVVSDDASTFVVTPTPDATEHGTSFGADAQVAVAPRPDAGVAVAPRADAAVVVVRPDAATVATVPRDAAVATVTGDAAIDKTKEARVLFDKAHEALEDGDPALALDLLEQSLKLRKTARSYLERARALQRLNRVDEAVAAVDEAIKLNSTYAPAYEQKGMILWSAQRYQEARPALQKYLELEPDGRKAPLIRSMLDEQR
jgi:hypothetical protein